MKVLVTGADGFVGRYLVEALQARGDSIVAAVRPGADLPQAWREGGSAALEITPLELGDPQSIREVADREVDAFVHLAAVASGAEARSDPVEAWRINVLGTVTLLEAVGQGGGAPRVLLVSSGEVYGAGGEEPWPESAPVRPISPYAASKAAAEVGALEIAHRTGLPLVVARPFPHTGPGQSTAYVVPSFLQRIVEARQSGAESIVTGNLDPVRDFLDVRDVAAAYTGLLHHGEPGQTYNVASGQGYSIREIFRMLTELAGVELRAEVDPSLARPSDIPVLVGDATRLRDRIDWRPRLTLHDTLRDMLHAQAN